MRPDCGIFALKSGIFLFFSGFMYVSKSECGNFY